MTVWTCSFKLSSPEDDHFGVREDILTFPGARRTDLNTTPFWMSMNVLYRRVCTVVRIIWLCISLQGLDAKGCFGTFLIGIAISPDLTLDRILGGSSRVGYSHRGVNMTGSIDLRYRPCRSCTLHVRLLFIKYMRGILQAIRMIAACSHETSRALFYKL